MEGALESSIMSSTESIGQKESLAMLLSQLQDDMKVERMKSKSSERCENCGVCDSQAVDGLKRCFECNVAVFCSDSCSQNSISHQDKCTMLARIQTKIERLQERLQVAIETQDTLAPLFATTLQSRLAQLEYKQSQHILAVCSNTFGIRQALGLRIQSTIRRVSFLNDPYLPSLTLLLIRAGMFEQATSLIQLREWNSARADSCNVDFLSSISDFNHLVGMLIIKLQMIIRLREELGITEFIHGLHSRNSECIIQKLRGNIGPLSTILEFVKTEKYRTSPYGNSIVEYQFLLNQLSVLFSLCQEMNPDFYMYLKGQVITPESDCSILISETEWFWRSKDLVLEQFYA